jgi:hypothetical protein
VKTLPLLAAALWLLPDAPQAADPAPPPTAAAAPVAVPDPDQCAAPNSRIVGPRSRDRPLPLVSGDAEHGFRPACSVAWRVLSPGNEPVPVEACYRGSLLRIANHQVCPAEKGKLWISARWVVTSAESIPDKTGAVACQHLQTQAWAATRGLPPPCTPAAPGVAGAAPAKAVPPTNP